MKRSAKKSVRAELASMLLCPLQALGRDQQRAGHWTAVLSRCAAQAGCNLLMRALTAANAWLQTMPRISTTPTSPSIRATAAAVAKVHRSSFRIVSLSGPVAGPSRARTLDGQRRGGGG